MTAAPLVAGVSCSGGNDHLRQEWSVGADRRLVLGGALTPEVAHALKTAPVPGTAVIATVDAGRVTVLLVNGETWRLDWRGATWRPCAPAMEVNDMKDRKAGPALLAAGSGCGVLWLVTPDRRLWTWNAGGRAPLADAPVPGEQGVLAVDVAQRTVVVDDGTRLQWLGGRWVKLGLLADAAATLKVRMLSGFCMGEGRDVYAGDELDMPEAEARQLIATGRAEPVVA